MQHEAFSFTAVDGTHLFAQSWSPIDSPKCVVGIVHGLGEHSSRYEPIAVRLVRAGYRVVTYDQRGHGRTKGAMPTFQTLVNDIDLLLNRMADSPSAPRFLYGQSLGGGLVIHHALSVVPPIAGVIASSPLLKTATEPPAWKLAIGRTLGLIWPKLKLGTGINPHDLSHDAKEVERYLKDPLVNRSVSAALGISMLNAGEWSLEHAETLTLPMLLMHGTADRVTSFRASEQFAKLAKSNCRLMLWPDLFHELHFDIEREKVLDSVVDWIEETLARTGARHSVS